MYVRICIRVVSRAVVHRDHPSSPAFDSVKCILELHELFYVISFLMCVLVAAVFLFR